MDKAGVIGIVLCGGQSRRMGQDKAAMEIGGQGLVDYSISVLSGICQEVVLACGTEPRYEDRGLRLVLDSESGRGPLEGIASGLEASNAEWGLVLACDLPRVHPEVPMALLERAREEGLDACLLESRRGREPLLAAYRRTTLGIIRRALSEGLRRADSFHGLLGPGGVSLKIGHLHEAELAAYVREVDVACNLNTPDDFESERASYSGGVT